MTNKVRILIVDDEPDILEAFKNYLEAAGDDYVVTTSQYPEQAQEILHHEQFDIVISDINMPKMSGIELLRLIKEEHPLIQVIMITAFSTIEKVLECLKIGASDYLLKPLTDMDEALRIIDDSARRVRHWRGIFMSTMRKPSGK